MTITPPTQRYYCAPDGNVHGQDIFETLFQSPNHERDLPVQIDAYGVSEFDMQFPQYQVVLLGPQVKYMLKTLSDKAASLNIPVQPIDTMDYGMQRGDNVLNYALSLIPAAH